MMMRGTKDEEKMMSPMFPRLHVNDTEKGGPRAPPRNKMALYEQLGIPSQRLSSTPASMLPLPPNNNGSSLVPSISSSHVGGYEKSVFTPFCNSPAPSQSEMPISHKSNGVKPSNKMASQDKKSMNLSNGQNLNSTQPLSLSAKGNSFRSHNFSNFNNFSWKKIRDENEHRVPSSTLHGAVQHPSGTQHSKDRENGPFWNLSFSMRFQNVSEKLKKGSAVTDLNVREPIRSPTEEHRKFSETCQGPGERSVPVTSIEDKASVDTSYSQSGKFERSHSLKRAHLSLYKEHRNGCVDPLKSLHGKNAEVDQDCVVMQSETVYNGKIWVESTGGTGKENASKGGSESCSRFSFVDNNRSRNTFENGSENHQDKQNGSFPVINVERHDVSETSMVDSLSALDISPDDVVKVIGEKQFWKARAAIVNQQRAFCVQVFELHRLIKVQKLIAGSPGILLADKIYLGKASLKASQIKKVSSDYGTEQPPLTVKPKDRSLKLYTSTEFANESAVPKLPLPSVNNEVSKELHSQQSSFGSHSGCPLPASVATNTRPSPWCFPPAGNQWLVPVMSPSEGLVYKPYSGPCPPTAGFMPPVYGNCTPMSLTGGVGDFVNAAYGVPASHQQGVGMLASNPSLGQSYFPPYGMPVMTPSVSSSAVEQVSPFTGHQSKNNQLPVGDFNFSFPHQSSCNTSSQTSRVMSCHVEKFQASKESEVQGSTASSPWERPKGNALALFPTEPTAQESNQNGETNEQRTRVIKVVPHNPRSATETAARIFQSIQEERKLYD